MEMEMEMEKREGCWRWSGEDEEKEKGLVGCYRDKLRSVAGRGWQKTPINFVKVISARVTINPVACLAV
jgi:hypothetical protein